MTKRREEMTPEDVDAARAIPGRWVPLDELSYSDQLREAFRGIKAAAVEHGCPAEVGAAIGHFEVVERNPPTPANAPSSAWMEAVARVAAERTLAGILDETKPTTEVVAEAVAVAMTTPPPAAPGGPNG